ncbi:MULTISPECIES: hypothetical protein [Cyanophyceae]|uniref:hypothetical protein n=1 Tax=Cyanophyceae TaxID=3028117 RepID=UPI001689D438|nr:hypothetical protein [Trichocoleus sp. FACHB-40]MBD2002257.1 hypothetical protein [Trichocoleus sp. FACHB-40]
MRIEGLEEYVLIDIEQIPVEYLCCNLKVRWVLYSYGKGKEVNFAKVNLKSSIAFIYDVISLEILIG